MLKRGGKGHAPKKEIDSVRSVLSAESIYRILVNLLQDTGHDIINSR